MASNYQHQEKLVEKYHHLSQGQDKDTSSDPRKGIKKEGIGASVCRINQYDGRLRR